MKTITIGRDSRCNVIINHPAISRHHAILRISSFGKMEIVDTSTNGTSVNGIRIRPNVSIPVKRKDVINFANVTQLDWSMIPDPMKLFKIIAAILCGVILLLLAVNIIKNCGNQVNNDQLDESFSVTAKDTISNDKDKKDKKEKIDSNAVKKDGGDFDIEEFIRNTKHQKEKSENKKKVDQKETGKEAKNEKKETESKKDSKKETQKDIKKDSEDKGKKEDKKKPVVKPKNVETENGNNNLDPTTN